MNTPTQGITPATTELTVKNTNNERSTLETKEHPSSSHATLTTTDAVKTTQQFTDAREAREIPQDGPSPSPTVDYGYTPAKLKPVDFGKDESTNPEPDSEVSSGKDTFSSSAHIDGSLVPSSIVEEEGKKRARALLDEYALDGEATKKSRGTECIIETPFVKQENIANQLSPLSQFPSHGTAQNCAGPSGISSLGEEPLLATDDPISVPETTKREQVEENPHGIFDDADEDESFDLDALKNLTPPAAPTSGSLRPDLVAAILGSPSKRFAAPVPAAAPPSMKFEAKKRKSSAKKMLRAKKEVEAAGKLLKGKLDLVNVLPEGDCHFLAKNFWIFTVDQLKTVLNATSGTERDVLNELTAKLIDSSLLVEDRCKVGDLLTKDSQNDDAARIEPADDKSSVQEAELPPGIVALPEEDKKANDFSNGESVQMESNDADKSANHNSNSTTALPSEPCSREEEIVAPNLSVDKLILSWNKRLQEISQERGTHGKRSFLLDGPLACLIPKCTQNFLKSAGIVSVEDFLSLKKTESGLVVDMYATWRKKCGLDDIPSVTIAKHLLALGTRLEMAIESLATSKEVREWMGGHAIVLSGQGRDFLFDHCKLYSAEEFLERRTKELADQLRDWRDAKGLAPLKGTGKVAMISAWKTLVKEAKEMEIHDGHVLNTQDLMMDLEDESAPVEGPRIIVQKAVKATNEKRTRASSPEDETLHKTQGVVPSEQSGSLTLQNAMYSRELLSDVLKKELVILLASRGITTAKELFAAGEQPDSGLITAIMKMRKDFSGDPSHTDNFEACVRLVRSWCQQVEDRLADLGLPDIRTSDKQSSPGRLRPLDRSSTDKKPADPWDALSQSSKEFLKSIGITDAESFLAAKTKHLADSFAKYRELHGMAPLKGLGSVASISGWKAIVRKAAKDAGQDRLVTLNAGRNAGIKLIRRPKEETNESLPQPIPQVKQPQLISKVKPPDGPDRGSLGLSKNKFWVANGSNAFCFELTQRRFSDDNSRLSWFLSYLGSKQIDPSDNLFCNLFGSPSCDENNAVLPVMTEMSNLFNEEGREYSVFRSPNTGLVELSKFGVSPRSPRGDIDTLKVTLKSFIFQENHKSSIDGKIPYNVFERWVGGKKACYFYTACPLEVGQTIELQFLTLTQNVRTESEWDVENRVWIAEEIESMSMKDLRSLLDFLNEEVGSVVYQSTLQEFDTNLSNGENVNYDLKAISKTIIARRRMHWSAVKINAALQKEGAAILPGVALIPLWSSDLVSRLRRHPTWTQSLCPLLRSECIKEILAAFKSTATGNFWITQQMWCAMAKELFHETVRLFSSYSAELDSFCSEQQLLDDLSKIIFQAVSNLKQATEKTSEDPSIALLAMRVDDEPLPSSNLFPSTVTLQAKLNRAYLDSMALCDEPPFELPSKNESLFLATSVAGNSASTSTEFQSLENFHTADAKIDIVWYIKAQVLAVVESVALCGVSNIAVGGPSKISDVCSIIRDSTKQAFDGSDIIPLKFEMCTNEEIRGSIAVPDLIVDSTIQPQCHPDAYPIFLSIVWPVLKETKWRMEAGNVPSSTTFYPPGRKKDKRTRHVKHEATIQRGKNARKTAELGLGYIPKQVKRMFVNCAAIDENIDEAPTVSEALSAFKQSVTATGNVDLDDNSKKIVEYLERLFENIAPLTMYESETRDVELPEGTTWSENLSCDYLMRFLLVVPKMLNQSELSTKQVEITSGVVAELIGFLVEHRTKWFSDSLQIPREEYETNYEFPKFIIPHLEEAKTKKGAKMEQLTTSLSLKDVVLPSDRLELTDFVTTVMDQLIICRATREDLRRKGRRAFLSLGCPGLMCRHCLGQYGEGKYFYSNFQSLSTAPTSIDKHISRCPKISNALKEKMAADRANHAEQKNSTPSGAQSAFFSRLWDRLQHSRTSTGDVTDLYFTINASTTDMENEQQPIYASSGSGMEFRNHVDIMTYIQNTAPWKNNIEVLNAVEKYYRCISFGGCIYNTTAMPRHHTSEWVLARFGNGSR